MQCVAHGSCVSLNYKESEIGNGRCEFNSTLQDTSDDDGSSNDPESKHLIQSKRLDKCNISVLRTLYTFSAVASLTI